MKALKEALRDLTIGVALWITQLACWLLAFAGVFGLFLFGVALVT